MANPIIKIKRGATAPVATLNAGEFAIDQVAKNLYLGVEVGGVTTNEIVGGEGTFATKSYVTSAVSTATGSLGTMSTQNADAVAITGGTIDGTTIGATDPSTGAFTTLTATELSGAIDANSAVVTYGVFQSAIINGNTTIEDSEIDNTPIGSITPSTGAFTTLTASNAPTNSTDVVRKTELDAVNSAVAALGSAFNYVTTVAGGVDAASATDLAALAEKDAGDYYKVAAAGYFVLAPASAFYANINDGLVFNTVAGVDLIDNTNSSVAGTANEIAVSGSSDTGYTVAIATEFKDRVSTTENKTQNLSANVGATEVNGALVVYGEVSADTTVYGTDLEAGNNITAGGNITATGTVSGTNIADLENKTQNINLANTNAGNTAITGNLSVTGNITDAVIDGGSY